MTAPPSSLLVRRCALLVLAALVLAGARASSASAASWWHLTSAARPSELQPGSEGEIIVTAANLGDTNADGAGSVVQIADELPPGLKVLPCSGGQVPGCGVEGIAGRGPESRGPVKCSKAPPIVCSFAGTLPPFDLVEVIIAVKVEEAASSEERNEVRVSGGGAQPVSLTRPIGVGESNPFGVEDYELTPEQEGGAPATQAGSHPFQVTTTISLNQTAEAKPVALVKDLHFRWPPGLVGNPTQLPQCSLGQFLSHEGEYDDCPPETVVGASLVTVNEPLFLHLDTLTVPVFNLEPATGEPARFGFWVPGAGVPVVIDPSIRSGAGEDYGITVNTTNVSQTAAFLSSIVTVWGVPQDPRHDAARGWGCLAAARGKQVQNFPCNHLEARHPAAFLTLPTSCASTPETVVEGDSWEQPARLVSFVGAPMPAFDGCNRLSFDPAIQLEPTTDRASAASGLNFSLSFNDEGLTAPEGVAQSQLKDITVALPEGLTVNPSSGVGLGGCTPAQYAGETLTSAPGAGCPNDSKLGTAEVTTPLLTTPIRGSLFIAQPYDNPFSEAGHPNGSLLAVYVVLKNPQTGILIKLAGKVTPNPVTGQLVTTFENNPQLAFDHFSFHFHEGQQAPLITPPTCGTYGAVAEMKPWSDPTSTLVETAQFAVTKGYEGGACPSGGAPPFEPQIEAGTLNNNAGAFSPFYLRLTRRDGDQEFSAFSTTMPSGLTGILSGIPFCPEADIALARTKSGGEEEASPSCPAASQVGHSLVGTGVGAVLAYTSGKLYLAGPYNGDPFSLVSVTSAVVGPFDLGTVVIRFGLRVDPRTAVVSVDPTASEPIPDIIHGIVTHVRDIRVYVDRPNFILNPTSCSHLAISSTVTGDRGAKVTVSSPFQAASCAGLKFAPKFQISVDGKASKRNGLRFTTRLSYPTAPQGTQTNIARVKVSLPRQLPSRLSTLQQACTSDQFEADPAGCPPHSIVGHATVHTPLLPVPLTGPVIFVSHGNEAFPSLVIVLQGYGVTVNLVGSTFISKSGITTTTFQTVPDVPFNTFELTLPAGEYSALGANLPARAHYSFCGIRLVMPTQFVAQNGAEIRQQTPIAIAGCSKKKHARVKHRHR